MRNNIVDCAVIGGGPGGRIAALYLQRFKRSVVLISKGEPRANWIPAIHNLIGYHDQTSGKKLLKRMAAQLSNCKTEQIDSWATIRRVGKRFEVSTEDRKILAKTVILATGMKDVQPEGIQNIRELTAARLVSYCPICDGFDHCDQKVALLVRDVKGFRKIPVLLNFTPHLKVIYIGKRPISAFWKSKAQSLGVPIFEGKLHSLSQLGKGIGIRVGSRRVTADVLYVALGTKIPNKAFCHVRSLRKNRDGFILTNSHQQTSVPGLYAVGDCVAALSQVSVAVGHAAIAATHIHNHLK